MHALEKVETRRQELETLSKPLDMSLKKVRQKMERTDAKMEMGRLSVDEYKVEIADLQRQERELTRRRSDIDPEKAAELESLEGCLEWAKAFWPKADLELTESGLVAGLDSGKVATEEDMISGYTAGIVDLRSGLYPVLTSPLERDVKRKRALLEHFKVRVRIKGNTAEIEGLLTPEHVVISHSNTKGGWYGLQDPGV